MTRHSDSESEEPVVISGVADSTVADSIVPERTDGDGIR